MVVISPALALGIGQAGLGILGGLNSSAEQARSAAYNATYQNLMIDAANRQRRDIFARQIDQAKTQQGFNADAANRAYAAEQRRLNDVFTQTAFQRQGLLENLIRAQGENNATEKYGNSARRANIVETLGAFGRQQAIMAESLASARGQSARTMQDIGRQHLSADYQNWQGVSIPPMMEANVPMPNMRGIGINNALTIGNSLMSGLNTFMSLRAPSGGSLGGGTRSSGGSFSGFSAPRMAFSGYNLSMPSFG